MKQYYFSFLFLLMVSVVKSQQIDCKQLSIQNVFIQSDSTVFVDIKSGLQNQEIMNDFFINSIHLDSIDLLANVNQSKPDFNQNIWTYNSKIEYFKEITYLINKTYIVNFQSNKNKEECTLSYEISKDTLICDKIAIKTDILFFSKNGTNVDDFLFTYSSKNFPYPSIDFMTDSVFSHNQYYLVFGPNCFDNNYCDEYQIQLNDYYFKVNDSISFFKGKVVIGMLHGNECSFDMNFKREKPIVLTQEDKKTFSNVSIYPNPSQNILFIKGNKATDFSIIDLIGNVVMEGNIIDNSISVEKLTSGMYIFKIDNQSYQFIKE